MKKEANWAEIGNKTAVEGEPEDQKYKLIDLPDVDVFGSSNVKKAIDCTCPNCDRLVAASRFAPHLEKCMGMGRATRVASRRIASSREGSNFFGSSIAISDDEDDADWSSEKKKKKLPSKYDRNGSKKNGKSTWTFFKDKFCFLNIF